MSFDITLSELQKEFESLLSSASSSKDLEQIKIDYFGKKGKIASLMMELKNASKEQKPILGQKINLCKKSLEAKLTHIEKRFVEEETNNLLEKEWLDISLPGRKKNLGSKHPVSQMLQRVIDTLVQMGFSVQYGPDIDNDFYNFESLNFSKDHPAKDMQDTFYIDSDVLLRTHTSNVQARVMETHKPPIRIIAPGKCFRNETISARSHVFFHQVEAFYIDENVSFSDLLSTLDAFWKNLLGKKVKTRFRPSYFPFVEPGLEVDVLCSSCNGSGCKICKQTGYLEVAGAGMVHPNVLKAGGIDPEKYSGYAWGLGVERLALLEYGIKDIRMFTENDSRFLSQFA